MKRQLHQLDGGCLTLSRNVLLFTVLPCAIGLFPQAHGQTPVTAATPHSVQATFVTGLIEPKLGSNGTLSLTPAALVFSTSEAHSEIRRDRISAVFVGDERVERGGVPGRLARGVIPYGGGLAVATVANKSVDLLTIEYRDERQAYHGVVFVLPTEQASSMKQQLDGTIKGAPTVDPLPCSETTTHPNSLLLEPIDSAGTNLPAEYRVLLYERLTEELERLSEDDWLYRAGDTDAGPGCTSLNLELSITAFKKGNQAVRASTGIVGIFVGATSVKFHMKLTDRLGKVLEDSDLKNRKGGDTESLNLARDVAVQVSKHVKKVSRSKP